MGHTPAEIFVGDAPGLDFLNSIATPVERTIDWIDDGDGLLNWLEQAQLVPADALKSFVHGPSRRAGEGGGPGPDPARVAPRLVREHMGRTLTTKALR